MKIRNLKQLKFVSNHYFVLAILPLCLPSVLLSQAELIADINQGAIGSFPDDLTEAGGFLFITADTGIAGDEIVKVDPNTGTFEVLDVLPGPDDSDPDSLTAAGQYLYFIADTPDINEQWRRYDTVEDEITSYVLNPNGDIDGNRQAAYLDGRLYFAGSNGAGFQGFVHDPVTEVTSIFAGRQSTIPVRVDPGADLFALIGSTLYFVGNDDDFPDDTGDEIWRVDLNNPGVTELITDIRPGSLSSHPESLIAAAGKLFFNAEIASNNSRFHVFDPLTDTVTLLIDVPGEAEEIFLQDDLFYFVSGSLTAGKFKRELFRMNPATLDVEQLTEGGVNSFGLNPSQLTLLNGKLYFKGQVDANGTDSEIFSFDLITEQLSQVTNISPGANLQLDDLTAFDDRIFFTAADAAGNFGGEVWAYDPMTDTSMMIEDLRTGPDGSSPSDYTVAGGKILFEALVDEIGSEIFILDPENDEITPIDILDATFACIPEGFVGTDEVVYFVGTDVGQFNGTTKLFRYDVMNNSVTSINDIASGDSFAPVRNTPSFDTPIAFFDDKILMRAITTFNSDLVIYDPASNTATAVGNQTTGPANPAQFLADGVERLYFNASSSQTGLELYVYDATTDQVTLAADVNSGTGSSIPIPHTVFNGKLYFEATTTETGVELFVCDPTTQQTEIVKDFAPGTAKGFNQIAEGGRAAALGDFLYFGAFDSEGGNGIELQKLSGTTGDITVIDVLPGPDGSDPESFTPVAGYLAFASDFNSEAPYIYNPETEEVKQIGTDVFRANYLTSWNDKLYFYGINLVTSVGFELYRYDPVLDDFKLIQDLAPGTESGVSFPSTIFEREAFVTSDSLLFFRGMNAVSGTEVFGMRADESIIQLSDINPNSADARPRFMRNVGGNIYFSADNFQLGEEPWIITPSSIPLADLKDLWLMN